MVLGTTNIKNCSKQSSAPKDGRNYRPKHVERIGIINKPLLLHLIGCIYYCISDARSDKYQINLFLFEYIIRTHKFLKLESNVWF